LQDDIGCLLDCVVIAAVRNLAVLQNLCESTLTVNRVVQVRILCSMFL
jgi:hypothetical protein